MDKIMFFKSIANTSILSTNTLQLFIFLRLLTATGRVKGKHAVFVISFCTS